VSREHRRAKTDQLDTELLKRSFLGWLRGERDHCKMVEIPTMKDEDAKRPNREHDSLIGERSRIVNRMKAALVRLGIRGFNPKLKRATTRLDGLRTPEGEPIPPNALAELRRDMERRRLVNNQIRQIEEERLERIEQAPCDGPHVMVRLLARVMGVGIEICRHAGARGVVAKHARPTGRSALCRPHWFTRRERKETPRERAGPLGQCPGPTSHDSIGVAVPSTPEEQCLDEVVSIPYRERSRYSKARDRSLGAQATDSPVAARAGGHCPRRRCFACGTMNGGR
jgi:hypothetical protein